MSQCPICQRNCRSKIGLISHIYWKHYKGYTIVLTMISFVIGIIITIILTANAHNISYVWDKYALNKEPDIYLSINSMAMLNNNDKIENLSEEQKIEFLNAFVKIGIIPSSHNQKRPMQFNIKDDLIDDEWCLFWAFYNANRLVKEEDLPIDLKNKNQKFRDISSTMPARETLEYLEGNCSNCLAYEIYGVNKGNRDVDIVNFELCFPEEHFIIKTSQDIVARGDHCIRIKQHNIFEKENFWGTVFVRSNNENPCWDIWFEPITKVEGKYVSKGKDFEINNDVITRVISGLVPNCHMSE